jgi:hypothetical protein
MPFETQTLLKKTSLNGKQWQEGVISLSSNMARSRNVDGDEVRNRG